MRILVLFFCLSSVIYAYGQVTVDFSAEKKEGCGFLQTKFINTSTGPIAKYEWSFGFGPPSTQINPLKIYISPGNYEVCLTATDTAGQKSTLCKKDFIKVYQNFQANFEALDTFICANGTARFQDLTSSPNGTITKWIWELSGTNGVVEQNEKAIVNSSYGQAGTYAITLNVVDDKGCSATITKPALKVSDLPKIEVDFGNAIICGVAGDIQITNRSPNLSNLQYEWDFGNGKTFTGYDPGRVQYLGEGEYSVSVKAVNNANNCSSSALYPAAVVVDNISKFELNRQNACVGDIVVGTSTSKIVGENHIWEFGNGSNQNTTSMSYSYPDSGCYIVRHIVDYKGCRSISVANNCLRIYPLPQVNYMIDKTRDCKYPFEVKTTNNSKGANDFEWQLNGVTIGKDSAPTIQIKEEGTYKIKLTATNSFGCRSSIETESVQGYKVKAQFNSSVSSNCTPANISLANSSQSIDPITNYNWTLFTPAPQMSNQSNFVTIVRDTGKFAAKLVITNTLGCTDSVTIDQVIAVGDIPFTNQLVPDTICFGSKLNVQDNSSPYANSFLWKISPGGSTSTEKNAQLVYDKLDSFKIFHTSYHYGCPGKTTESNLFIKGSKANFDIIHNCTNPFLKSFQDKSTSADSLKWEYFSNDTLLSVSSQLNPDFIFPKTGDFKVRLSTINQSSLCLSHIKEETLFVRDINAGFSLLNTEGCVPLSVSVLNQSKDATLFKYNFIGASNPISTDPQPSFRFDLGGIYRGELIATDVNGCTDTVYIDSILAHQVIASFNPIEKKYCQDSTVKFDNTSIGLNDSIKEWTWQYAAISIKNIDSISVRMDKMSIPSVKLSILSNKGCTSEFTQSVNVNQLTSIITGDTLSCINESIKFIPVVSGAYTTVHWDFGDKTQVIAFNPNHKFEANGKYAISMTVSDTISGCDFRLDSGLIVSIEKPQALFTFTAGATNCKPFVSNFRNLSTGGTKFTWDFGDNSPMTFDANPAHLYINNGLYSVSLITESTANCRDTLTLDSIIQILGPVIQNKGAANKVFCTPEEVRFDTKVQLFNSVLIEWGDGTQDTFGVNSTEITSLKHQYISNGVYIPIIVAVDSNECFEFVFIDTVTIHQMKNDLFIMDTTICGISTPLEFKDSVINSLPNRNIQFRIQGSGLDNSYTSIPIGWQSNKAGIFSIQYISANTFCADTVSMNSAFIVHPGLLTAMQFDTANLCDGTKISIWPNLLIGGNVDKFNWMLDGKSVSNNDTLSLQLREGKKNIQLFMEDQNQCADTLNTQLDIKGRVYFDPLIDITSCEGSPVMLSSKILNHVNGTNYVWAANDSALCRNCINTEVRPLQNSIYSFSSIHPSGCVVTDTIKVTTFRNTIPLLSISNDTTICEGDFVPLSVDAKDDVYVYQWDSTRPGLSCYTFCRNPLAHPLITTTYPVFVSTANGCERMDSVTVNVTPKPSFDLGQDRTICKGDTYTLNAGKLDEVKWSGSSSLSCTNCADPVLRPISPVSTYVIEAIKNACKVKDSITLFILNSDFIGTAKDTTICTGSSVNLTTDFVSVIWSPTTFLQITSPKLAIATPISTITYTAKYTKDLCTVTDTARINVLSKTEISGRDWTLCPEEEITLIANGQATSFEWQGPHIVGDKSGASIDIKANEATTYRVIARNTTCAADTAFFNIKLIDFINLSDSITYRVIPGLPFQLNRTFVNNKKYNFNWATDKFLSCADCPSPIFQGEINSSYLMTVTDPATGCMLDQTVHVLISNSCNPTDFFKVPNIFTPNNDGVNDILSIIPLAADQINSFRIFNRNGVLQFQTFDISIGWNGTFRNRPAPSGTYLYMVEGICPATGKSIILKGDVTLIR